MISRHDKNFLLDHDNIKGEKFKELKREKGLVTVIESALWKLQNEEPSNKANHKPIPGHGHQHSTGEVRMF